MGCGNTKQVKVNPEVIARSKAIDKEIQKEKEINASSIKLLLLGPGESGKTTILKQMRLLHDTGFSGTEIAYYRIMIRSNIVSSMMLILNAMRDRSIPFENAEREVDAKEIHQLVKESEKQDSECVSQALQKLWADSGVQECAERGNEFNLMDSAKYFMESIDRIHRNDYIPTVNDMLRCRVRTTGVNEIRFKAKSMTFRVVDVGGQRSERKKWITCFNDVNSVIFVASLSDYDQCLFEDNETNRMIESLRLFDWVANHALFRETHILLFLNKTDLFAKKIQKTSLKVAFPENNGSNNVRDAMEFVKGKFDSINESASRQIFMHETCATDTKNIKFILDSTLEMIIGQNAKDSALI